MNSSSSLLLNVWLLLLIEIAFNRQSSIQVNNKRGYDSTIYMTICTEGLPQLVK